LLYKKLSEKKILLTDLGEIEAEVVQSFETLREMRRQGEDIGECSLTFSVTTERLDRREPVFPLKSDGETIAVTNDNLDEYIELYSDFLMNGSIKTRMICFNGDSIKCWRIAIISIFCTMMSWI
jgi:hypothetical protein